MKRDLLQQAYDAMRHDLRKTVLTMLGMAWGIATVVLLLAYGEGFGRAVQNIFEAFGATAIGIFPGRTSQQAGEDRQRKNSGQLSCMRTDKRNDALQLRYWRQRASARIRVGEFVHQNLW